MSETQIDHGNRKHALLSASGSSRWMSCTPSARLEEKYLESNPEKSSKYAEEGTLAHEFGELSLRKNLKEISDAVYNKERKKLENSPLFYKEMPREVDLYVDYVLELFAIVRAADPSAILLIEERFDFTHIIEQGFGTGDVCIIGNRKLYVIDLKFGKGLKVQAYMNPQLMLYGCGALKSYELVYDIDEIELTIVQPRLNHISTFSTNPNELTAWGESTVKPAAKKAYAGQGVKVPGDHCKWCKVKGMCKALADKNIKLAQHEFKDPDFLTHEEIIAVYKQLPMLVDWANAVGQHMLSQAMKGHKWEGYKAVEGTIKRRWQKDQEEIKNVLDINGFAESDYLETSLVSVSEVEKLVGKKAFHNNFSDFVLKPQGSPVLALESDPRPALGPEQAKQDFAEPFEEDELLN